MLDVSTQAVVIVKKEERIYSFECANNSNLGEIYDVLMEMKAYIAQRIQEVEKSQQASQPQEAVPEAPKEV